jgi:flagellar biosynthesis/type III secretory pathway protein FliH
MTDEDRLAERIRLQEKAAHDYASDLDEAFNKGKAKGIAKSEAEAKNQMVKLIYRNGATIDEISKFLELPVSEINDLLNL